MGFGAGSGGGTSFTGGSVANAITEANGTKAAPAYSFTNETSTGLYWRAAGLISASVGGANFFDWYSNSNVPQSRIGNNGSLVIASGELDVTAPDVGLGRISASVLKVTDAGSNLGWLQQGGYKRVGTLVNNATATMSNLTDLSVSVQAGRKYSGTFSFIAKNSTAAEGVQFDFNGGSATWTSVQFYFESTPPGVTIGTANSAAVGTAITATTATTADRVYKVYFDGVVNAAGTLIPRFAEVSHTSGTATVEVGSTSQLNDFA